MKITCCKVVRNGNDMFCDKDAETYYLNINSGYKFYKDVDLCCFCKDHDYKCGIEVTKEQAEQILELLK